MCGTKRLNPFFRLHKASEVLDKYVMGVWSDNFTATFSLVSLWLFLFLTVPYQPNSAPPQNAYRGPQWLFIKTISALRYIPRPNGLHNKTS